MSGDGAPFLRRKALAGLAFGVHPLWNRSIQRNTGIMQSRRWIPTVAIVLGSACAAWAAAPAPLTSLHAVHALSNQQASLHGPVAFEATVTYFRGYQGTLFVQEGDDAIFAYVQPAFNVKLRRGDRVLVKGTTRESFRPYIVADSIQIIGRAPLPTPVRASFSQLSHSLYDCRLVTIRGQVRTADLLNPDTKDSAMEIFTPQGTIDVTLSTDDIHALKSMLDAEVEITGAASGDFDGKMQQTGVLIHVTSLDDIKVLKRSTTNLWSLPATPMDQILTAYNVENRSQRVNVSGTITYDQPGYAVVLQSGLKSLWIVTHSYDTLQVGDTAVATGIPDIRGGFLTLAQGEVLDTHRSAPIVPLHSKWNELTQSKNIFDLVTIEGQVVTTVREAAQDEYVLLADGQMFTAILRHPVGSFLSYNKLPLEPMKQVAVGSRIQVTGICNPEDSHHFDAQVPFNILLRSSNDIVIVAQPSWINVKNLIVLVSLLLLVLFAAGFRAWKLERKVRRQTADLAARTEAEAVMQRGLADMEKRRSRILEEINGASPLAEILLHITELLSFRLHGAPCWCQCADDPPLGNPPSAPERFRLSGAPILSRTGERLGTLFAAFDPALPPSDYGAEELALSAGLATLAIETRRLYSDLRHRSEYDLLTDIHNRFALDKHLDRLIEDAQQLGKIFGIIYIDLNKFKQINDIYGHRTGDLYLQQVALRMENQLRSHDILARIGGDEFCALATEVTDRAGVDEIAQRLEQCFNDPFAVEGVILHGSASVGIAMYPQDGNSKDSLLNAADAAMYSVKNENRLAVP
jgi:diguanylate cyclase (GGDEF)-like protein